MNRLSACIRVGVVLGLVAVLASLVGAVPASANPAGTGVVISQVYGGGGNSGATLKNDFIELYNPTAAAIPLNGWSVQYAASAGTNWQKTDLLGSIPAGGYYLIQQAPGAGGTVDLPTPNATGTIPMSATAGKVVLLDTNSLTTAGTVCPAVRVDAVGYGSGTTCAEGTPTATLSNTAAALRQANGATDTDNNSADFTVGAPNPRTSAGASLSISDVSANEGNSGTTSFDVTVSLSSAAGAGGVTFDIATADGTATTANSDYVAKALTDQTIPAGSASYAFSVTVNGDTTEEPNETFLVNVTNVTGAAVTDAQGVGTILNDDTNFCTATYTPIPQIQGSGNSAAVTGTVATKGVVVGDYEGAAPTLRGFYLQDASGDGNGATSDGIFVFNGSNNSVSVGDVVHVRGTAAEFQDQTQITASPSGVTLCGTGSVAPVDVTLPLASADALERYEGMLVRLSQTLYVTEHFQLGRFGQITMSSGGVLQQPTNVVAPGALALLMQAANNLNRIIVDDALQNQNPEPIVFGRGGSPLAASNTLRTGDTATGMIGVLTYTWAGNAASGNAFRVRPQNALGGGVPSFQPTNPRPASPPAVGGNARVAALNVLNYFNTFDDLPDRVDNCTGGVGGAPMDCRGADTQVEFDRQWPKTVAAITGLNADVIGLMEIENDGYGPASAIQHLVDRLNAATAPGTYAFIDADAATGQVNALGTDAIKVGMLYKPARVMPVGQTVVLNSVAFVNGGDPVPRSRPSLAQAFQFLNGERFIVDANHLKSKSAASNPPCTGGDAGDGQGDCNQVRVNAARELVEWLASDPTGTGDPDVLIVGDLNAYAMEDPITVIRNAGYTNLIASFVGPNAYSYLFDGQFGYLDHALATPSLTAQVSGVGEWHINADEPSVLDYNTDFKPGTLVSSLYAPDQYRMSDHDPLLVGLDLEVSYAGLCNLVRHVVTDAAVVEGLCDKLAAAEAADERGNAKARDNALSAFRNQVEAQTGKSISEPDAATLKLLSLSL